MPKVSAKENSLANKVRAHLLKQDKVTLELQTKNCKDYDNVKNIVHCKLCLDPEVIDDCLFKGFRAFNVDKHGLHFGYYFPNAVQEQSPLSRRSKRFDYKSYDPADRHYLKAKLKSVLKDDIVQDRPVFHQNDSKKKVILRKDFQQYRHLCDLCLTSIFNHHYVCPMCAMEVCTTCYANWNKKPLANDEQKNQCVEGTTHPRRMLMACQKYSSEEMAAVEMELDEADQDIYMSETSSNHQPPTQVAVVAAVPTVVPAVASPVAVAVLGVVPGVVPEAVQTAMQTAVTKVPEPWLMPLSPISDDQNTEFIENDSTNSTASHISSSCLPSNSIIGSDYIPSPRSQCSRGSSSSSYYIPDYSDLQCSSSSNNNNNNSGITTNYSASSLQLKTNNTTLNNQGSSVTGTSDFADPNMYEYISSKPSQSDGPSVFDSSTLLLHIDGPTLISTPSPQLNNDDTITSQLPSIVQCNDDNKTTGYDESIAGDSNRNSNDTIQDFILTDETEISLPTRITESSTLDVKKFQRIWAHKDPLMVEGCLQKSKIPWKPEHFGEKYGNQEIEVIDCEDFSKHMSTAKEFFDSYGSKEKLNAYCEKMGTSGAIKIKDWPPKSDFKEVFSDLYHDYMNNVLPVPEYCSEKGFFNLSNRLPEEYMPPDLGPKMFISQASTSDIKSRTKLHCDMTDAVNVMCYSAPPPTPPPSKKRKVTEATTITIAPEVAAVWDIFASKDLEKLRKYIKSRNNRLKINEGYDPILSESTFLEEKDLKGLKKKYGVKPFRFHQKAGDCVFVPAGCAHQVQNVAGSIKCAYDFLSPETLDQTHLITNQTQQIKLEDKLQVKSTLLYTWKSL